MRQARIRGFVRLSEEQVMSKAGIMMEFGYFLKANKKLWLLPMVLVLLFLGAIFALGQYSAVAPFIYTLF